MSAASVDTGKIIDLEVLSKHCTCQEKLKNVHDAKRLANYAGTSGGIEVVGAEEIFKNSLPKYNVRYKFHLLTNLFTYLLTNLPILF